MTFAVLIKALRFLGNAVLIALAVGTLGSFMPEIPAIGELGPVLTANVGIWITIVALIGAVIVFRRWRANRRSRTLVLLGMATFAALGSAYIGAQQLAVAKANGAHIDLSQALMASSQQDDRLKPITVIYAQHVAIASRWTFIVRLAARADRCRYSSTFMAAVGARKR